ncbi:MAG TPA: GNAT family N-acetyltransferase [Cytophagales bacterium]|nr:GNAT family N-acetyltransferase [Cytophagales bacterium]HCR53233.1 GNAT family N-acetyltransferase [Cytophagales bacterium]
MNDHKIIVRLATPNDSHYSEIITEEMAQSAQVRGTGISRRSPEYVKRKMEEGKSIIAVTSDGTWVGFCYIEVWDHEKFVANSGLIVAPAFRQTGVAREIKSKIFDLSRHKYPNSKIFGLTTGLAVMKINSSLGYKPVTYSELTTDEEFWKGCQSCVNFDILTLKQRKNCICTAMLFNPATDAAKVPMPTITTVVTPTGHVHKKRKREFKGNFKLFERWVRLKKFVLLRDRKKNSGNPSGNVLFKIFFW